MTGTATPGVLSARRRSVLAPLLFLVLVLVLVEGCAGVAPTRTTVSAPTLEHVVVGDRRAAPADYGRVQVYRGGLLLATQVPMRLQPGDELATGPDSAAVIGFPSGAAVIVYPETRVRISSLKVIFGEVSAILEDIRGLFEVETDDFVAAAGSTEYLVGRSGGGAGDVAVFEGRVRLSSPAGAWPALTLSPRERATVSPGRPPAVAVMDRETYNRLVGRANAVRGLIPGAAGGVLVPDLAGLDETAARRLVDAQGLSLARIEPRVTGEAAVGTVVDQVPPAGTRAGQGSGVTLVVAAESAVVPWLLQLSRAEAEQRLRAAGLRTGAVRAQITGEHRPDTVIGQAIPGDELVARGSAVDLVVEAESVPVPPLRGLSIDQARGELAGAGLRVGDVRRELAEGTRDGQVLDQSPRPGAIVAPGAAVGMVVAIAGLRVPNLVGTPVSSAGAGLSGMRLRLGQRVEVETGQDRPGTIIAQSPAANELVGAGTAIDVQVARAPTVQTCVVPAVLRYTWGAAKSAIAEAGLTARPASTAGLDDGDRVVGTDPGAGDKVPCGSVVVVTVLQPGPDRLAPQNYELLPRDRPGPTVD